MWLQNTLQHAAAKFAHMNGQWKACNICLVLIYLFSNKYVHDFIFRWSIEGRGPSVDPNFLLQNISSERSLGDLQFNTTCVVMFMYGITSIMNFMY